MEKPENPENPPIQTPGDRLVDSIRASIKKERETSVTQGMTSPEKAKLSEKLVQSAKDELVRTVRMALFQKGGFLGRVIASATGEGYYSKSKKPTQGKTVAERIDSHNRSVLASVDKINRAVTRGTDTLSRHLKTIGAKVDTSVKKALNTIQRVEGPADRPRGGAPGTQEAKSSLTNPILAALGAAAGLAFAGPALAAVRPQKTLADEREEEKREELETPKPKEPERNEELQKALSQESANYRARDFVFKAKDIKFEAREFKFELKNGQSLPPQISGTGGAASGGADASPSQPSPGSPTSGSSTPFVPAPSVAHTGMPSLTPPDPTKSGSGGMPSITGPAGPSASSPSSSSTESYPPPAGGPSRPVASAAPVAPSTGKQGPGRNLGGGGGQETASVNPQLQKEAVSRGIEKAGGISPVLDQFGKPTDQFNRASHFKDEINNQALKDRMFALTLSEHGTKDKSLDSWQGGLETMFNRAQSTGKTLGDLTGSKPGQQYYAPYMDGSYNRSVATLMRDPKMKERFEEAWKNVLAGSNKSNYGTDEASGSVAANARRNQTPTAVLPSGQQLFRKDINPGVHGAGRVAQDAEWFRKVTSGAINPGWATPKTQVASNWGPITDPNQKSVIGTNQNTWEGNQAPPIVAAAPPRNGNEINAKSAELEVTGMATGSAGYNSPYRQASGLSDGPDLSGEGQKDDEPPATNHSSDKFGGREFPGLGTNVIAEANPGQGS